MSASPVQRPIGFSPAEISALVNREVVEIHAEEAAFLWLLRDDAVKAPHYSLQELADLDERVEAHLDGLRVASSVGWEICEQALGREEPGEVFAAGVLAFGSEDAERMRKVVAVAASAPELERGLIAALGWLPFDQVKRSIKGLFLAEDPKARRVGIAAAAVHRKNCGPVLAEALGDADARLRARAIRSAGELGRTDLLPTIVKAVGDADQECRFWAGWAAARLGDRSAPVFTVLRQTAEALGPHSERALDITLRCLPLPKAKGWFRHLIAKPETKRLAAKAGGIIGDPDLASDLIALMGEEALARVAGESLSSITGTDLAYDDLDEDQPEDFETGPSESPEDKDVAMDADDDLPWPKPSLVASWWHEQRGNFQTGKRYLRGKPISKEALIDSLVNGKQRQRAAAALELAVATPSEPLFEVRAPGKRQQGMLKAWTS
jgi:uncharacterized protein (TIGR02270 family)